MTVAGNLTNNNAAPNAFNLGVLPAIAETAYATITYTAGNQVLPVVDLHGAMNVDWQALAGTALGGPTLWGTAPTGEQVQGVNAYCVQGTSPWVVSLASTTITGTVAVTQSGIWTVQQGGAPWTFVGALTNNNAAPAATNIGVLPAIAETAYNTITYTTGDQVLPVTDLHGALNQDLQAVAGVALGATAVVPYGSTPAGVNVPAVNAFITNTPAVTVSGTVAVTQSTSPWVVSLASTTITGTVTTQGNLTNNNAVPNAFNLGVLPAIAETTYTTLAYTSGDQVLPATDSHGALWSDLAAVAGVALGATAVTAFGSAPAAANVPGVNASLFSGTTPLTNTGGALNVNVTNPTTSTVAGSLTNNNAAPIANNMGVLGFIAETAYATATYTTGNQVLAVTDLHGAVNTDWQALAGTALGGPTTWGTAPTAEQVQGVNAFCIQGTSPWVVSLASTTITGTVAVTQSTSPWVVSLASTTITGTVTVAGNLTNNNAVPNTFNVGVLPAIAESAYTNLAYTTGDQVLPATDLHGALFSDLAAVQGVALGATAVVAYGSTPAAVNVPAVNAFITNTPAVTVSGTVAVTQSTSPWVVSLASTTITGTVAVTQSGTWTVQQGGAPWSFQGNLTNNNAAPNAFNVGVLPAIAETTYNTVTYTTGDQVLPVTDLHGALNQDLQAVAGVQLGATAVVAFGSAPAAVNVPAVNASLFSGTTALTNTGGALNVNITGTVTQTTQGNLTNNNAAPNAFNVGVLPAIANAASPAWTEGDQVLESVDLTGRQRVRGTLTNNNAAPVSDNVGVLPAIAETAWNTATYTTGNQVLIAVDTHGAIWNDLGAVAGTAVVTAAAGVQKVGIAGATGATMDAAAGGATAPTNAMLTSAEYNTTPLVLTNGQAGALQSDTTGALYVNIEGRKQTYSCFATFTPVAGDIAVLSGSASKTIRITRVEVSMSTSGTAGVEAVTLVKRSAADTGGTSAAMTAVPHDSNYAAASAAPRNYTAAPTLGTAVGTIRGVQFFDDSNAATGANTWLWDFGTRGGAACIVLRGVAQQLAINLGGVIATQTVTVSYEWEEDNS